MSNPMENRAIKINITRDSCLKAHAILAKKIFDLVKSSNFYAPSKPSFQWFATAHGESGES